MRDLGVSCDCRSNLLKTSTILQSSTAVSGKNETRNDAFSLKQPWATRFGSKIVIREVHLYVHTYMLKVNICLNIHSRASLCTQQIESTPMASADMIEESTLQPKSWRHSSRPMTLPAPNNHANSSPPQHSLRCKHGQRQHTLTGLLLGIMNG